jgi:hypothetical protein
MNHFEMCLLYSLPCICRYSLNTFLSKVCLVWRSAVHKLPAKFDTKFVAVSVLEAPGMIFDAKIVFKMCFEMKSHRVIARIVCC